MISQCVGECPLQRVFLGHKVTKVDVTCVLTYFIMKSANEHYFDDAFLVDMLNPQMARGVSAGDSF